MHNNVIMCRYCKIPNHFVWKCRKFAALSAEERIKFVDAERLCNGCLKPGHVLADCWRKVQCDVNGCKQLHSFLLHSDALVKKLVHNLLLSELPVPLVRVRHAVCLVLRLLSIMSWML